MNKFSCIASLLFLLSVTFDYYQIDHIVPVSKANEMNDKWGREANIKFMRPWSERRGISFDDHNADVILVRLPLDDLSKILAEESLESRRNVLGSEIELSGPFVLTYQLTGHIWSIIVPDQIIESGRLQPKPFASDDIAQLSKRLKQPVIRLIMSDTTGVVSYSLFEDGRVTEYFSGWEGELASESNEYNLNLQQYVLSKNSETVQTAYFYSCYRKITAREIGDVWDFASQFLQRHDAFYPGIDSRYLLGNYSLKRGRRYQVQNQGFKLNLEAEREVISVPDLVGVDYFRFK